MEYLTDFGQLLAAVQAGKSSLLEVEIDGVRYLRNFRPRERLLLLGGGHIAQALCRFAAELDFDVTVADDRLSFANRVCFPAAAIVICDSFPAAISAFGITEHDYVAVLTRGHRWDADCLRVILKGKYPRYLGMIGSKRRTTGLLNLLESEGFHRELLDKIHTPIGLNIGALTTKEIGISILAELIACRRIATPRRSKSTVLTGGEDIDINVLELLADTQRQKVLMLVYETEGSTPVKSGAMMVVDQDFQTAGTIGGGCSEDAILRDAFRMVGTGKSKCLTVDMSNDIAEEEGMVCGGRMKVWLKDIGCQIKMEEYNGSFEIGK